MQRLKAGLAQQGLRPADLPAALVVHEVLGAAMAAGFWATCYAIQPSLTALGPLARSAAGRYPALARTWETSLAAAQSRVARAGWIRARADPARLTVSLAESLVLRAAIKPATFVFKLWASAAVVRAGKRVLANSGDGGRVAAPTKLTPCQVEALKKCLEENRGDQAKCAAEIEAFKAACGSGGGAATAATPHPPPPHHH